MLRRWPAEGRIVEEPVSGHRLRQITTCRAIHHHPFFFVDAFDEAANFLAFISHRTGAPQIFVEHRAGGDLLQLTDLDGLSEWSVIPARDGSFVYFVAAGVAMRVDPRSGKTEALAELSGGGMGGAGMVGAALGTTALSPTGRWWAIPLNIGNAYRFLVLDTQTGAVETILERDTIGHPQFCPDDDDLILYAGPMTDRVWLIRRDGTGHRRLYEREHAMQWITHEIWWPGRGRVLFVDWPNGLRAVSVKTGVCEWVSRFPVWHGAPDRQGRRLVCDTNFPDRGLHVIDLEDDERGLARFLCRSDATSRGDHWGGAFPYNDGPVKVYAPQHTHPHPRFSPDGRSVIFTSDRTGYPQLYEVGINDDL